MTTVWILVLTISANGQHVDDLALPTASTATAHVWSSRAVCEAMRTVSVNIVPETASRKWRCISADIT